MRLFLKLNKDLRYLLHEYDSEFPEEELVEVYESIMNEYQKLSGNVEYGHYFERLDTTLWDYKLLNAIELTKMCLRTLNTNTGFLCIDEAKRLVSEFNLKLNGKKIEIKELSANKEANLQLDSLQKSIQNRIIIRQAKEKEEREKESNKQEVTWNKLKIQIQFALKMEISNNCSVADFVSYQKLIKELNGK